MCPFRAAIRRGDTYAQPGNTSNTKEEGIDQIKLLKLISNHLSHWVNCTVYLQFDHREVNVSIEKVGEKIKRYRQPNTTKSLWKAKRSFGIVILLLSGTEGEVKGAVVWWYERRLMAHWHLDLQPQPL